MIGRADFVEGLGATLAALGGQTATAKKKKKCKKPPRCPSSCSFLFYEPGSGGGKFRGTHYQIERNGALCVPCSPSNSCVNTTFLHCLNSVEMLSTGQISYFNNPCAAYTDGVCGNVSACVT